MRGQLLGDQSLIHERLRNCLVARHLGQHTIGVSVVAGITDLKDVAPGPDANEQSEGRRHARGIGVLRRALPDCLVASLRRLLERSAEVSITIFCPVITTSALGDVTGDTFESHPACLSALLPATDTVRNHHEGSDSFFFYREHCTRRKTRQSDVESTSQRADEEVILILGANFSRMS